MQKQIINLTLRFHRELCTFQAAQRAAEAGMTCANTYFAYDSSGKKTTGAWLHSIGFKDMLPCISFPFAVSMLEETNIDFSECECYMQDDMYHFKAGNKIYTSANLVDALVEVWINHKK